MGQIIFDIDLSNELFCGKLIKLAIPISVDYPVVDRISQDDGIWHVEKKTGAVVVVNNNALILPSFLFPIVAFFSFTAFQNVYHHF